MNSKKIIILNETPDALSVTGEQTIESGCAIHFPSGGFNTWTIRNNLQTPREGRVVVSVDCGMLSLHSFGRLSAEIKNTASVRMVVITQD